jgi:hypothetical protein
MDLRLEAIDSDGLRIGGIELFLEDPCLEREPFPVCVTDDFGLCQGKVEYRVGRQEWRPLATVKRDLLNAPYKVPGFRIVAFQDVREVARVELDELTIDQMTDAEPILKTIVVDVLQ